MQDQRASQAIEIQDSLTCDSLRNSVTPRSGGWSDERVSLYDSSSARKYLNHAERNRALTAMQTLETGRSLFAQVLAWTGARVSEVLALNALSFDIDTGVVSIATLKRRKFCVRQVPIPPQLMRALARHFCLRHLQADDCSRSERLWTFCRMTAWRIVKRIMQLAGIVGAHACPKGLRHAFGVGSLHAAVPITLVQRWMGHARLSTTAIYLDVCGPEELSFARRFWSTVHSIGHERERA